MPKKKTRKPLHLTKKQEKAMLDYYNGLRRRWYLRQLMDEMAIICLVGAFFCVMKALHVA